MPPASKTTIVKGSQAAKHAFLYLTSFATLALLAFSIGALCFQFINAFFPEVFQQYQYQVSQEVIKISVATIFITAPVFYFVTHAINQNIAAKDLDMDSGVRKWLTYIVLFFAVGTVIGDLVTAIYYFLDGDITIRFLLQVLTILIIAGSIFLYYFTDIRNESKEKRLRKNNIWAIVFWFLVLIPFCATFFILENPTTTRQKRIDAQTTNNLETVRSAIQEYYQQKNALPDRIEEVDSPQFYISIPLQELAQRNFRYVLKSEKQYQLCADFERQNSEENMDNLSIVSPYAYVPEQLWKHDAGNFCFTLEAVPSFDTSGKPLPVEPVSNREILLPDAAL